MKTERSGCPGQLCHPSFSGAELSGNISVWDERLALLPRPTSETLDLLRLVMLKGPGDWSVSV